MGAELEPLPPAVQALPSPRDFGRLLRERLESEIKRVRDERGDVQAPEDAFALVRSLQAFREVMEEYAHAMTSAARVAVQEAEEELLSAVGDQDGVPNSGLTVPDIDGTEIKMSLLNPRTHHIDQAIVLDVLTADALGRLDVVQGTIDYVANLIINPEQQPEITENLETFLAGAIRNTIDEALALGTYSQQVTKVKAFGKALAGRGEDKLAGVISQSMKVTTRYAGVKLAREEGKK